MVYEPEGDPRHLPDVSRLVWEHHRAEVEEGAERLAGYISSFESIEALFEQAGWAELVAIVGAEADQLDTRLITDTDMATWRYHRGQRSFADFILTLPQLVDGKLRELRGAHGRLQRENEELQDRLGG